MSQWTAETEVDGLVEFDGNRYTLIDVTFV
jgi:hypothetical protein